MEMRRIGSALLFTAMALLSCRGEELPFEVVFQGKPKFEAVLARARPHAQRLREAGIGERTAWFGQLLTGTTYKGFTLEIHDRIEAPSANFNGLDCWTFFEISLALARMTALPPEQWDARRLLQFIEQDRYWGGRCDGSYLSRLHYLEDWAADNERRGLVRDLTRELGGIEVRNAAREMTTAWKSYRYMAASAANREGIAKLEARLRFRPLTMIPLASVPGIEKHLRDGDIISIVSRDGSAYATSHVGLALRREGVLHFMHASSPRNHGKVLVDSRLSEYLRRYKTHAGIMVARPLR